MARWIISFAVVLILLCILYYVVRLRTLPEDEIKEHRHEAAENEKRRPRPKPARSAARPDEAEA